MSDMRRMMMMFTRPVDSGGGGGDDPTPPTPVLPYDAQVEYLQSVVGAYIDTGITASNTTGFSFDFQRSVTNDCYYAGMRQASGNTRYVIGGSSQFYVGWNSVTYLTTTGTTRHTVKLNLYNSREASIDDTNINTLATLGFTPTRTIWLFKANDAVNSTTQRVCKGYGAQVTVGNQLVRDFIPVRKDGVGYFYDKVSGELFGNAGTGTFAYGDDVPT